MAISFQQTDISASVGITDGKEWLISAGAAAGTASHSQAVLSGGVQRTPLLFATALGVGGTGTASWVGSLIIQVNITTANANITWSGAEWNARCNLAETAITTTSALGISLGTTGVKTASLETTTAFAPGCTTATAGFYTKLTMSNAATMNATFNYLTNQVVTFPETSSAAPAPSAIFTLAQMNVGQ